MQTLSVTVKRSFAGVAAAIFIAIGTPVPASARVVVSVQIALGSAAVGGLGVYVASSSSWETLAPGDRGVPDALIEFGGARVRFGMPLSALPLSIDDHAGAQAFGEGLLLNLIRLRF
jgi:hypothetical protein